MQETTGASGLATARTAADPSYADSSSLEALKAELAKWQERVPKLAGALRERTGEVEALRKELAELERNAAMSGAAHAGGSGIQARDALIEELEAKVKALSAKYQDAEGQLHARDLEIAQLRQETGEWREKWQSVTANLDEQADGVERKTRELNRQKQEIDELLSLQDQQNTRLKEQDLELTALRERAQSLEARNENLFETTELANRQIETLGENLEHLRGELKASKQALANSETAFQARGEECEALKNALGSRDQDIEFLHGHVEEKQNEINRLTEQLADLEKLPAELDGAAEQQRKLESLVEARDAEIAGLSERLVELDQARRSAEEARTELASLKNDIDAARQETAEREAQLSDKSAALAAQAEEVARLEECVASAGEATGRFEAERRQLSEQLDELKKRNDHLESQLTERSDLVVGLEQEKTEAADRSTSLEAENKRLSDALEKAQQAAQGNADHIAQVDARLERQKQLMENLETEFAEVQEEYAEAVKTHQRVEKEHSAELAALKEKINDDNVAALKHELGELESSLKATEGELEAAREAATHQEQRADDAARELEGLRGDQDSLRAALSEKDEKVEKLEKQLRKQSKATSEAEEAAERVRAELEARQAQEDHREPDEVSGENALLQAEVIKLEGMVRERTEQLNKLRWQQDMIEKQADAGDSSEKMLVVLNQQLQSAREETQRLKDRVRELESQPPVVIEGPDDLSRIKGIGPKLVKQLKKLGITQFDQIATLSDADLDDTSHPLHTMKGRIVKDDWIVQAARLGGLSE